MAPRTVALASLLSALLPVGGGHARAEGIDLSHGGQIQVSSLGGFDWNQNDQTVTAYDHAQAIRGNVTVTADRLIAFYRKKATSGAPAPVPPAAPKSGSDNVMGGDDSGSNEIYRLQAIGHVHIFTDTDQAWGDKAVYDMDQATLLMTGSAMKVTTPNDVMTARDVMEYHSQTHISIGRGNATVTTNDGRRVNADVLVAYSKPSDTTTPNATNPAPPVGTDPSKTGDPLNNGSTKLEKVNAFGHVMVRTQTETVTGDRGVYVPDTGMARIVGRVKITRGANQLNGSAAIVNMHTGLATMTQDPGTRVQGLVVPNEANSKPAPTGPAQQGGAP
nr:LptA/OstA family protein [Ameyamaea chiangmaiensis]